MIEQLNREHPEYRDRKEMWQRYWDFYAGGEQLRRNASHYMVRRQKEPNDVYAERLSRVFYENYLGSCIDWYASALFRSRPEVSFRSKAPQIENFYTDFIADSDRRGNPLVSTLQKVLVDTLVLREGYVLIDFPRLGQPLATQAEEDAAGKSRAYLVRYSPRQLINWRLDSQGDFEWIVLRTQSKYQEKLEDADTITEERWLYFDRENFRTYSRKKRESETRGGNLRAAVGDGVALVAEGRHGLADLRRVPLVKMSVTEGLWLANKAALLQQEHFNKSNALSWALHMGLFAMPVIYSEREWQQIVGEAYYIQLGSNDRFGWTEPEGHVFQIAADNLDRLKDETYRVCYMMSQAGGREARHLGQSGISKQRDFAVTHEVLRSYGNTVKDFLRRVLNLIRLARRDDVEIGVAGMDKFDMPDFSEELANAEGLQALGVRSSRFQKEVHKRIALQYLESASQETKNEVAREIEAQ